jgi:hypothetical protein
MTEQELLAAIEPNAERGAARRLLDRSIGLLHRHGWLLPAVSFAVGWVGFLLVQRGAELARWVAVLAIIGWPWLLLEPLVRRLLEQRWRERVPVVVANFISQSLQQELLFFSLPLLIGATQADLGQWLFTGLTIVAALVSTIDPLYEKFIAARAAARLAFHAWCSWVAALVVLPMVAKIPLERALPFSLIAIALWILLMLPLLLRARVRRRWKFAWLLALLAAPGLLWLARGHIPAAGLSVRKAVITQSITELKPGPAVEAIPVAELGNGVIAFAAIRAPMGVAQSVVFSWCHRGRCENIVSEIRGQGSYWRTYSRKQNFPENPVGEWRVDLRTPQGQLLSRAQFVVN